MSKNALRIFFQSIYEFLRMPVNGGNRMRVARMFANFSNACEYLTLKIS